MCRAHERASEPRVSQLCATRKTCHAPQILPRALDPYPPTTIQFRITTKKGVMCTEPSLECVTPGMGRKAATPPQPKNKQKARQATQD
eukprot:4571911-Prymnesium_polylepis.1